MGIAALILGIISVIVGFIPLCGIIALVPAVIGLILGIIDMVKKKKAAEKRGMSIAGVICSGIAIVIIIGWYILAGAAVINNAGNIENFADEMENLSEDLKDKTNKYNNYNFDDYDFDM